MYINLPEEINNISSKCKKLIANPNNKYCLVINNRIVSHQGKMVFLGINSDNIGDCDLIGYIRRNGKYENVSDKIEDYFTPLVKTDYEYVSCVGNFSTVETKFSQGNNNCTTNNNTFNLQAFELSSANSNKPLKFDHSKFKVEINKTLKAIFITSSAYTFLEEALKPEFIPQLNLTSLELSAFNAFTAESICCYANLIEKFFENTINKSVNKANFKGNKFLNFSNCVFISDTHKGYERNFLQLFPSVKGIYNPFLQNGFIKNETLNFIESNTKTNRLFTLDLEHRSSEVNGKVVHRGSKSVNETLNFYCITPLDLCKHLDFSIKIGFSTHSAHLYLGGLFLSKREYNDSNEEDSIRLKSSHWFLPSPFYGCYSHMGERFYKFTPNAGLTSVSSLDIFISSDTQMLPNNKIILREGQLKNNNLTDSLYKQELSKPFYIL